MAVAGVARLLALVVAASEHFPARLLAGIIFLLGGFRGARQFASRFPAMANLLDDFLARRTGAIVTFLGAAMHLAFQQFVADLPAEERRIRTADSFLRFPAAAIAQNARAAFRTRPWMTQQFASVRAIRGPLTELSTRMRS